MLAFAVTCAFSCKKSEGNDNALLKGTQWIFMDDTRAVVDNTLYLSFDAETFTMGEYIARSVEPAKIRQGTFLYKKPWVKMDFSDGTVWKGVVSDEYIDFGDEGQFKKVEELK
jgi:hypothetical protein